MLYRRPDWPVIPPEKVGAVRDAIDLAELIYANAAAAQDQAFTQYSCQYLKQMYTVQSNNMAAVKIGVKESMVGGLAPLESDSLRYMQADQMLKVMRGVIDCQNSILAMYLPEEERKVAEATPAPNAGESIGQTLRNVRGSLPPETTLTYISPQMSGGIGR